MPNQCPTCFRVNPAKAAYCYYDGRGLNDSARNGPVGLGTLPFRMPFSFADGHGCVNFNQLVLACDRRWIEARNYLVNGTWKSFFGAIGRADLAALAVLAANQTDPDVGLCFLLEKLPADAEALRPPKLALTSPAENLGALAPGQDYKVDVVIENQGMLLLRGSVTMDCEWLAFGDGQGNTAAKLFQTRDTYNLSVRVLGNKLRAGKKPLEARIVIDTNGGRQTVALRATVPIRPFPGGNAANDVLAGCVSPREIAVKAKAHPKEAAVLFERGAVKAWYESNGWTYPIAGTQAKGKSGLQQFFEALGLTKTPRLEINTERIVCQGEAGKRLTKNVIVRTAEARFVHAEAHSNQDWVSVQPPQPHGNFVTIPLSIEIPPCPGETLNAVVTFLGNGQQRFVVPVTLSVASNSAKQEEAAVGRGSWLPWNDKGSVTAKLPDSPKDPANSAARTEEPADRRRWLPWVMAGGALALCLVVATWLVMNRRRSNPAETSHEIADGPKQGAPKIDPWWAEIPGTNLSASVAALKKTSGENRALFERLEGKSEIERRQGYEELAAKLPELARKPETREPLGRFVTESAVYEPSGFNIEPLLRGVAHQFPAEDSPFPPGDKGEAVERASFWLRVVGDTIGHKAAVPDRSQVLVGEINNLFGSALEWSDPPQEFVAQAEKALAQQCYRNLPPTAEQSIEQALKIRDVLIAKFPRHLETAFRDPEDVKLLAAGLSKDNDLWPRLEPIFKTCADSNAVSINLKLIDLYEKANAGLAPKMETILAAKWKAAGNPRFTQAAKAEAIRRTIAARARAAKISPAERIKRLQDLAEKSPLAAGKPDGPARTTPLLDAARLAHASAMACILYVKDADVERFDELVARVPGSEAGVAPEEKKTEEQPPPPQGKDVLDLGSGNVTVQGELTTKDESDPRRDTYRKVYEVRLKAGEIYVLDMRSTELKPFLRVETVAGVQLAYDRGANTHIIFPAPADGVYHIVASTSDKQAVGHFTLQVARQQFIRFGMPRVPPPLASTTAEQKAPPVNLSDLADLENKQSTVRLAAFKNLTRRLPNDLAYRHAIKIANYLLLTEPELLEAERDAVTSQLPALAKCRHLLEALADVIASSEKLAQRRTELLVGGLVEQNLRFARDQDWRSACRKLLLQRALEQTGRSNDEADKIADSLRDSYKEQGLAFGLDDPAFLEQTQLTVVVEALIKHLAGAMAEKGYAEQTERQIRAAHFAAENDLQYMVFLQRLWIKVLVRQLQERLPPESRKKITVIEQNLDNQDRDETTLVGQLRSGEATIFRLWALAHDLKLK